MTPAYVCCAKCCATAGWTPRRRDLVAYNAGFMLMRVVCRDSPGLFRLDFDGTNVWAVCGCGWRPLPIYVVIWEDSRRPPDGLVAALTDDGPEGLEGLA